MNKAEFNAQVTTLLKRVERIPFDDYYAATDVLDDFERFALEHIKYLNMYTTEHVGELRTDFDYMNKYQSRAKKRHHFNAAIRGLTHDVKSMLENTAPD
jgi:hypothetical protein